jgi:hypothetical protein
MKLTRRAIVVGCTWNAIHPLVSMTFRWPKLATYVQSHCSPHSLQSSRSVDAVRIDGVESGLGDVDMCSGPAAQRSTAEQEGRSSHASSNLPSANDFGLKT